jgi:hypothetical protein
LGGTWEEFGYKARFKGVELKRNHDLSDGMPKVKSKGKGKGKGKK